MMKVDSENKVFAIIKQQLLYMHEKMSLILCLFQINIA